MFSYISWLEIISNVQINACWRRQFFNFFKQKQKHRLTLGICLTIFSLETLVYSKLQKLLFHICRRNSQFNCMTLSWWPSHNITLHCTASHRIASHYTALHCTALHCTALHCTALHCTALHCTALHSTALHCTALHSTPLHSTALHCTPLHCTPLHSTALHCTPLHFTAPHRTASHRIASHHITSHHITLHYINIAYLINSRFDIFTNRAVDSCWNSFPSEIVDPDSVSTPKIEQLDLVEFLNGMP